MEEDATGILSVLEEAGNGENSTVCSDISWRKNICYLALYLDDVFGE